LSERAAGRVEHAGEIRAVRDGGSRSGAHGSRAVARESFEPTTRVTRGQIPHHRYEALAVYVCPHRPSRPCRPDRAAVRTRGPRQVETWVFTRRGGQGHWGEQKNPRAPHAERARKVAAVVFSEPPSGTGSAPPANHTRERRGSSHAGGVQRWRDAANTSAASAQHRNKRNQENGLTSAP